MFRAPILAGFIAAAAAVLAISSDAHGGLNLEEGHWRVELATTFGVHSGSTDRSGNALITGTVEYEVPATPRTTLGLRLMPLFVYTQSDEKDHDFFFDFSDSVRGDSDTVWGGGLGLTGRVYQVKNEYRGWFAELEALAVGHANKIDGNSGNLNFLIGAGVGYKFKSNWHTVLKYEHISNASISENNAGANSLGIGIGYSF